MSLIDRYADSYAALTAATADGWATPPAALEAECDAARGALRDAINRAFCLHQTLAAAIADPASYFGGTTELSAEIVALEKRIGL